MEEGKFDNLPGQGQPFTWDDNPYEDPEWRMANHMLKSSGYSLPWIETRREIEAALAAARATLARTWNWRQAIQPADETFADAEWQRAVSAFRESIADINRKIASYNLVVPASAFQLAQVNADQEIEAGKGEAFGDRDSE
jgi:hypothetical protein